jgi:V8-like Glu-specific endopeptidase
MKRFEKEKFKFVGKRDPSEFGVPDSSSYENLPDDAASDGTSSDEGGGTVEFVRITGDGHEYIARYGASELARGGSTEPIPNVGENVRRSLVVLGTDTRSKVTNTQSFPFSAISEIDFKNSGEGGCTSTLISRNAALTAGHCVFNTDTNKFQAISRIAPGRYRSGSSTIEPYGTWEVDYSTTFSQWKDKGPKNYDIAVMTLLPREVANGNACVDNVYPGDAAGFVGIARPSIADSRLNGARVTGYPADRADGEMWTSGACSPGWDAGGDYFGFHYCDTYGGNSGSSVLTTDNKALGVHGYGFPSKNGACLMHGSHYDAVYEWSDQGKSLPAGSCRVESPTRSPTPTTPRSPSGDVCDTLFCPTSFGDKA